jgi:hypothetical protein
MARRKSCGIPRPRHAVQAFTLGMVVAMLSAMTRFSLLALLVLGGCMSEDEEYQPTAPAAHSITCPSQLVLTGGPYTLECTIEYESNGFSISDISVNGYDSRGSSWVSMHTHQTTGSTSETLVVKITSSTSPALGELTIAAVLINYSNDVYLKPSYSNSVSTTVAVVAP